MDENANLTEVNVNFAQALSTDCTTFAQLTATNNQLSAKLHHNQHANALLQQQHALAANFDPSNP